MAFYKRIFLYVILARIIVPCIEEGEFPAELKHADIVPIHNKKDNSDKCNYRPLSILSNYSKVYEKLIHN